MITVGFLWRDWLLDSLMKRRGSASPIWLDSVESVDPLEFHVFGWDVLGALATSCYWLPVGVGLSSRLAVN